MDPVTLAAIALGGAVLFGGKKKRRSSGVSGGGWAVRGDEDRVYWLNEVRSMSHWYSNQYNSMPFLADYMTVVGFIESRFNPATINPEIKDNPNAARGLFGIRPETAFKTKNGLKAMRAYPNALLNPRWAFVTALFSIWQACDAVHRKGSGVADWASIRRWWGYPSKVHDFNFDDPYSAGNLERFEEGLHGCNAEFGTNIDPDFVWQKVQGWNNYPGMQTMIQSFGLQGVYA